MSEREGESERMREREGGGDRERKNERESQKKQGDRGRYRRERIVLQWNKHFKHHLSFLRNISFAFFSGDEPLSTSPNAISLSESAEREVQKDRKNEGNNERKKHREI